MGDPTASNERLLGLITLRSSRNVVSLYRSILIVKEIIEIAMGTNF